MLETGLLRDREHGRNVTWLYLRTHLRKSGERLARAEFRERYGRWPQTVQRLSYVTWAAGPLGDGVLPPGAEAREPSRGTIYNS